VWGAVSLGSALDCVLCGVDTPSPFRALQLLIRDTFPPLETVEFSLGVIFGLNFAWFPSLLC